MLIFLKHILQNRNDKVIAKTVRLLPTNYIINLFRELSKRLQGHAQAGLGIIKWLKALLMTHTSYLMSVSLTTLFFYLFNDIHGYSNAYYR